MSIEEIKIKLEKMKKFLDTLEESSEEYYAEDLPDYMFFHKKEVDALLEYNMVDKKYIIHLTDEQYRKVIDLAQRDAKKEIVDKIDKKIEWLKQISDNGINAVRFAASYEDEIERKERQKNISTTINILEELKEEN